MGAVMAGVLIGPWFPLTALINVAAAFLLERMAHNVAIENLTDY